MKFNSNIVTRAYAYKKDIQVPVSFFFSYPELDTESIECGILFDQQVDISKVYQPDSELYEFSIRSISGHNSFWIPRFRTHHSQNEYEYRDKSIRGTAELLFEGTLKGFPANCKSLECYIYLQDNALTKFYDETQNITWVTPMGSARLIYDYPNQGFVVTKNTLKHRKISQIQMSLDIGNYQSLEKFLLDLADDLDNLMWLISFLSNQYIHWYQFDLFQIPEKGKENELFIVYGFRDPSIVRWNSTDVSNHPSHMLVQLDEIRSKTSNSVFSAFQKCDPITLQLITMIMITYTDSFIEHDLLILYTALETIVNHYHQESKILSDKKFKKLSKLLRNYLNKQSEISLSDQQLDLIAQKIPELQRIPYRKKVFDLFDPLISSLPEMGKLNNEIITQRLNELIRRRNNYIHTGLIKDMGDISGDIHLLRFLISIWILDQLHYPLDQINIHAPDLGMIEWAIFRYRN